MLEFMYVNTWSTDESKEATTLIGKQALDSRALSVL